MGVAILNRGARRVPRWSSFAGAAVGAGAVTTAVAAPWPFAARRHSRARLAVVRQDPDFGLRQRGVGLDAIDQRGAARRRRERPLDCDERRMPPHDDVEGVQRVGVGERQQLALRLARTRLERLHQIGGSNENGTGLRARLI